MNVNELKVEMVRHGENGADLATLLDVSEATISSKMNSKTEFTRKEICKIKEHFDMSPERVDEIFFSHE